MMTPNEPVRVLARAQQRQAHERRFREVEAAPPVRLKKGFKPLRLLFRGKAAPILLLHRQVDTTADHLQGPLQLVPDETRPQDGMSVRQLLPRTPEGVHVESAAEVAAQLL